MRGCEIFLGRRRIPARVFMRCIPEFVGRAPARAQPTSSSTSTQRTFLAVRSFSYRSRGGDRVAVLGVGRRALLALRLSAVVRRAELASHHNSPADGLA